jgi:hypothetical protein
MLSSKKPRAPSPTFHRLEVSCPCREVESARLASPAVRMPAALNKFFIAKEMLRLFEARETSMLIARVLYGGANFVSNRNP